MRRKVILTNTALAVVLSGVLGLSVRAAINPADIEMSVGKVQLVTAGALAFGPPGILFVGDSVGASLVAIDTGDTKAAPAPVKINVDGLDVKIAAMVGIAPDQLVINDVIVNPLSKNVYVSASRGRGPDAMPLIVQVDGSGKITPLSLDKAKHISLSLVDAPDLKSTLPDGKGGQLPARMQTITSIAYVDGNVMVAGLSNEEWSSALRSIPYPFKNASPGTTLQIWHSPHGRYETESPVRTFVPYTIGGKQYILAAYTCTPLAIIPVSDLKPGAKVKGMVIADLGIRNIPLDMIPYAKDGHDYILIANTLLGVLKLKADNLENYPAISEPTRIEVAGVPYDTISDLTSVQHLAQLDDAHVLVVTGKRGPNAGQAVGPITLATVDLP